MVARLKFEIDDKTSEGFAKIQKAAADAARTTAIETDRAAKQAEKASKDAAAAAKAAWKDFADSGTKYGSEFHQAYVRAQVNSTNALKTATDARTKATAAAGGERDAIKGLNDQIAIEAQRFRDLSASSNRANRELEAMRGLMASAKDPAERLRIATDMRGSIESLKSYNAELSKLQGGGAPGGPIAGLGGRGAAGGAIGGDAGGGRFSTMANRVNALNLVRGHEMQLRGVAGILDALGPTGVKLAAIGAGAGSAALAIYGTVKALDMMGSHGSKSAKALSDAIKAIPGDMMKAAEAAEEFIGKRLAKAFDSAVRAGRESAEGMGLMRPENLQGTLLDQQRGTYGYQEQLRIKGLSDRYKGEDRDAAIRRNVFEGRVAFAGMDNRTLERDADRKAGRESDVSQMTNESQLYSWAQSLRRDASARLERTAPREQDLKDAMDKADKQLEGFKSERESLLARDAKEFKPGEREAILADRNMQRQAAEANRRNAELELKQMLDERQKEADLINTVEARKVEVGKMRSAAEIARRDRGREIDLMGQTHAEDLDTTRTGMSAANRADSLDRRAAKLREQADRERQQLEVAKNMHIDTQASREAFAQKIGKLEAEASKIEEQRFKEQKDGIKDQTERHRLELEQTKQLIKQQEASQDTAETEEKRDRITKELTRSYQKEVELLGKIFNHEKELLSLEERRTREVEARGEAEARIAEESARREQERKENRERERIQSIVGGLLNGPLAGPTMGVDQNALNLQATGDLADKNAAAAAEKAGKDFDAKVRKKGGRPDDPGEARRRKAEMERAAARARAQTWKNAQKSGFVSGNARDFRRMGGGRMAKKRAEAQAARAAQMGQMPGNNPMAMAGAQGAALQNIMGALMAGGNLDAQIVAALQQAAQVAGQAIQDKAALAAEVARIDAMLKALMNGGNNAKNQGRGLGMN